MHFSQINYVDLKALDQATAIFYAVVSIVVLSGVRYLKANAYFKYFAVSLSLVFISTAAYTLNPLAPRQFASIEYAVLLLSMIPIVLAAYKYRRMVKEAK